MGKDKFENEDLIAFGFPEDIWFHVDNISSAHVYLRLPINQTIDDIPEGILEDCLQLVKFNSITGCKQSTVDVVFTPWSNLKKTNGMETGQVGFHDEKLVKKFKNVRKEASVLNRLLKTKREEFPDLKQQQEDRMREIRGERNRAKEIARQEEVRRAEEKRKERDLLNYVGFMDTEKMVSNSSGSRLADDFW
eukprot:TRINITY_DN14544_c0_g1_i11.p1 TRINITY_DN14544_c0_g1~~TRINITY_DN14544_c0_g1_i11.p1  ORF type:complete len:192 (-),score=42.57 TRINITY_DN14544_c0_g1_i11:289-864(-)